MSKINGSLLDKLTVKKMAKIDVEIDAGKRKMKPLSEVIKKHGLEKTI